VRVASGGPDDVVLRKGDIDHGAQRLRVTHGRNPADCKARPATNKISVGALQFFNS
jgi:hypothetical protein